MNIRKIVFTGIAVGIASNIYGLITCRWLFKWVYFIDLPNIWKASMLSGNISWLISMGTMRMLISIITTLGYAILYKGLPFKSVKKGIAYGLLIWLLGLLPSRILLYLSMNISASIIIYWILDELVSYMLLGAVIGICYKE